MLEENKNLTYKRTNIRIASNFFSEAKQTKKEWNEIFEVLNKKIINLEFCALKNYPSKVQEK